jgi:hypothetical protein
MTRDRFLALFLRAAGSVTALAFVSVVMPRAWMEATHGWLGLGEMPDGAITMFMIRQASFTYGLHGMLLWLLSSDVIRFRPLVLFTGGSYLLAGPVFFLIDLQSGMPWFWTAGDTVSCSFVGAALLWLNRIGIKHSNDDEAQPSGGSATAYSWDRAT